MRTLEKARVGRDDDATEGKQRSNSSGGGRPPVATGSRLEVEGAKRNVVARQWHEGRSGTIVAGSGPGHSGSVASGTRRRPWRAAPPRRGGAERHGSVGGAPPSPSSQGSPIFSGSGSGDDRGRTPEGGVWRR
jgi:hypothetical protein